MMIKRCQPNCCIPKKLPLISRVRQARSNVTPSTASVQSRSEIEKPDVSSLCATPSNGDGQYADHFEENCTFHLQLYLRFCESVPERLIRFQSERETHIATRNWAHRVSSESSDGGKTSCLFTEGVIKVRRRFSVTQTDSASISDTEISESDRQNNVSESFPALPLEQIQAIWKLDALDTAPIDIIDEWGDSAKQGGVVVLGLFKNVKAQLTATVASTRLTNDDITWTFECWVRLHPCSYSESHVGPTKASVLHWTIFCIEFESNNAETRLRFELRIIPNGDVSARRNEVKFLMRSKNTAEDTWSFISSVNKDENLSCANGSATVVPGQWTFLSCVYTVTSWPPVTLILMSASDNSISRFCGALPNKLNHDKHSLTPLGSGYRLRKYRCGATESLPFDIMELRFFDNARNDDIAIKYAKQVLPQAVVLEKVELLKSLQILDAPPDVEIVPRTTSEALTKSDKVEENSTSVVDDTIANVPLEKENSLTPNAKLEGTVVGQAPVEASLVSIKQMRQEVDQRLASLYLNDSTLKAFYESNFLLEAHGSLGSFLPTCMNRYPKINPVARLRSLVERQSVPIDPYALLIHLNSGLYRMHQCIITSRILEAIRVYQKSIVMVYSALLSATATCVVEVNQQSGTKRCDTVFGSQWVDCARPMELFYCSDYKFALLPFSTRYSYRLFRQYRLQCAWSSTRCVNVSFGPMHISDTLQAHIAALSRTIVIVFLLYVALRIALQAKVAITSRNNVESSDSPIKLLAFDPLYLTGKLSVKSIWEGSGWTTPTEFYCTLTDRDFESVNRNTEHGAQLIAAKHWGRFIGILLLIWSVELPFSLPPVFREKLSKAVSFLNDSELTSILKTGDLLRLQSQHCTRFERSSDERHVASLSVPSHFCYRSGKPFDWPAGDACHRTPLLCSVCCASYAAEIFPSTLTCSNISQHPCMLCGMGVVTLCPQEPQATVLDACPTLSITCRRAAKK